MCIRDSIDAGSRSRGLGLAPKHVCRAFKQLIAPLFDLVGMNVKLLCKFAQSLLTANGCQGNFRFEGGGVIAAGSSCHGASPVVGRSCQLQAEIPLISAVQISQATSIS